MTGNNRDNQHLVIMFRNIGGYHAARIRAIASAFSTKVSVIELIGQTSEHPWGRIGEDSSYDIHTLYNSEHEISSFRTIVGIYKLLNRLQPDFLVLPGWGSHEAHVALWWARIHRVPVITMSESKYDDAPRSYWKEKVKSLCFISRFDAAIVGGRPHRDYLIMLGMPEKQIFLGYDVVDNDYFIDRTARVRKIEHKQELRKEHPEIPLNPYFLTVNRFISRKNLLRLLRAYHQYIQRDEVSPVWDLVFCGGGVDEVELIKEVERLGLASKVHFPGFITYEQMPNWYAYAGAFVHPALQEQWGLVVNEAAASSLPIICSSTVGACAELIENGVNGFEIDPLDETDITNALCKLANLSIEERNEMGVASKEIISKWSPDRFAEGLLAAIQVATGNDVTKVRT